MTDKILFVSPHMSFDAFIGLAWNDHENHPDDVAKRLATSLALIESTSNIIPYVRIVTHVFGEHLGLWCEGVDLLQSLRGLPVWDDSSPITTAVARGVATLRYIGGEGAALDGLFAEDRIVALATAASALAGRHQFKHAVSAYTAAMELGMADLPSGSPAIRALAVGGNNLAAGLETKADRDAVETEGMVVAAEAGLRYWKLAGTWLEEERAEYRLARSLLQAGDHGGAIRSATRCVEVCSTNQAPPFEEFFGHAVLALTYRAAGDGDAFDASRRHALQLYELIAPEERRWCESELIALGGS